MKRNAILSLVLLLASCGVAQAQTDSDESEKMKKSLKEKISKEMTGWTHRAIQPIEGSQGVIIQHWELGDIVVKIAVARWSSEEEAKRAFKEFKSHLRIEEDAARSRGKALRLLKEELSAVGDEGYVSDVRGSEAVAFRKGNFMVDVSVPRPYDNKDVFFSRKFAKLVAKALAENGQ